MFCPDQTILRGELTGDVIVIVIKIRKWGGGSGNREENKCDEKMCLIKEKSH